VIVTAATVLAHRVALAARLTLWPAPIRRPASLRVLTPCVLTLVVGWASAHGVTSAAPAAARSSATSLGSHASRAYSAYSAGIASGAASNNGAYGPTFP
jgi:uncharacterized membrane protein